MRRVFEQLEALGWVTPIAPLRAGAPEHWKVNPLIYVRFAERVEQERQRRENARRLIVEQLGHKHVFAEY